MKKKRQKKMIQPYFVKFRIRNMLAVIMFTIGGIFIGRTLWEVFRYESHPVILILVGFLLIFIGGIILHNFDS